MATQPKATGKGTRYYLYGADMVSGLVGPFDTLQAAEVHLKLWRARGDAANAKVLTEGKARSKYKWEIHNNCITPAEDCLTEDQLKELRATVMHLLQDDQAADDLNSWLQGHMPGDGSEEYTPLWQSMQEAMWNELAKCLQQSK